MTLLLWGLDDREVKNTEKQGERKQRCLDIIIVPHGSYY